MKENALKKQETSVEFVLNKLIESTGLELPEFCRKVNLSYGAIYQLVNGINRRPNLGTLVPIVKYFDITLEQLIGEEPLNINHKKQKMGGSIETDAKNTIWKADLYNDCVTLVSQTIKSKDGQIGMHHFLDITNEVYQYSIKKELSKADVHFVEWYCKHHLGY